VLAFADDVVLMAESKEDFKDIIKRLIKEIKAVGLKINVEETKFMHFGRNQDHSRSLYIEYFNYEKVEIFKYLGTIISSNNIEHSEIQSQKNAPNTRKFALVKLLSSKLFSVNTKLKIYKTLIRPIFFFMVQ
jgi:uncharacterized protein YaaR (DUF327 family)